MSDRLFENDDDDTKQLPSHAEHLRAIEAVVMVAHDPVPPELLAQLLERSVTDIERWCHELATGYELQDRGFQLVRVAGGYRYQTHADLAPYVERFLLHDQRTRLSGAALETLAIVAYKQPISRAQVASIRGVDPDGVLRTLQGRGLDRRRRTRPRPGSGRAVRHDGQSSSRSSVWTRWTSFRRSPSSSPVPTWSRPSRPGCGQREPTPQLGERTAAGSEAEPPDGRALQKVLASRGWGSRRACEELIAAGRVTVNGEVAQLGRRVDAEHDHVEIDGAPVGIRPSSSTTSSTSRPAS